MSNTILVGYASHYGSTQEVAEAIAAVLGDHGLAVDLRHLRKVKTLADYSAVVIGAPLFMFHWHEDAHSFLSRHHEALLERPVAIFALGPVHDPHDEQEWLVSHAQLDTELAKYPWLKPVALELFGGKYSPGKLRFPINVLAGDAPASDLRDWATIRAWADNLAAKLA